MKFLIVRLVLVIVTMSMAACSDPQAPPAGAPRTYPTSEATNTSTTFLTESIVTTRIRSARIVSYSDQDSAWAFTLDVDFYDVDGDHTSTLKADSALIREKARLLEGFGNVRIVTDDGQTLVSPHLAWDDAKRLITTDSLVIITRGDDVMSGYGFTSDPELTHIRLRKQVSGRLTDPGMLNDSL